MARWELHLPDDEVGAAAPGCAVIVLRGRLQVPDVAALRLPLRVVDDEGAACLVCDVTGVVWPDLGTVDALARLQVLAHRLGRCLVLRGASECLLGLIELTGLAGQLPSVDAGAADGCAGRAEASPTDEFPEEGGRNVGHRRPGGGS